MKNNLKEHIKFMLSNIISDQKLQLLFSVLIIIATIIIQGCTASKKENEKEEIKNDTVKIRIIENDRLADGDLILKYAFLEQKNEIYKKENDSTPLFWLNGKKISLYNRTKCNIFAINTLYKAGFKTPNTNARTSDLMNVSLFDDIFPLIQINDYSEIAKGDLICMNGHVMIFDSLIIRKNMSYALGIWAGTRQKDNGKNINNNVCYGNYPLNGFFRVRRPIRIK